jgi:pyruvate-ferredoxin/flavodoxin oxidoreductase
VYSNTGGQASKATPLGAVAKFAMAGKPTGKKDLAAIARRYGNVYVAQVAIGGSDIQTVKAFSEADAWDGPSLIIAYSTCIAHGIDMETSMSHQKDAVKSGYWPLYRYKPTVEEHEHPFQLDSAAPSIPLRDFALKEARFSMLARSDPDRSRQRPGGHRRALEVLRAARGTGADAPPTPRTHRWRRQRHRARQHWAQRRGGRGP